MLKWDFFSFHFPCQKEIYFLLLIFQLLLISNHRLFFNMDIQGALKLQCLSFEGRSPTSVPLYLAPMICLHKLSIRFHMVTPYSHLRKRVKLVFLSFHKPNPPLSFGLVTMSHLTRCVV